ncbi:MAG: hypothetical protein ACLP5E_20685 [Streptosporangiaceae bacterium]
MSSGKVTQLLHLFDAAGELYQDTVRTEGLLFLGPARTFIQVINPSIRPGGLAARAGRPARGAGPAVA